MPVVRVDALEVEGAADVSGEDLVSGQVGRVLSQLGQIVCCHLLLDLVPALGSFTKRVGLYADHFDRVLVPGDSAGIFYRGGQHKQHRLVCANGTMMEVAFHAQLTLGCLRHARSNDGQRTPINRELWRFARRIVGHEHGAASFIGLYAVEESITPGVRGSHVDQVFDVDSGDDRVARAELFARPGLDAYTAPVLQDQSAHRPARDAGSSVILDYAAQRLGQVPVASFGNRPAVPPAT